MRANVQLQKTSERVTSALNLFLELEVFMEQEWQRLLLKMAHSEHDKAWLPWTRKYWQKRIDNPALLQGNRTYYNSPNYIYWAEKQLVAAKNLSRRYSCARNQCSAGEIILNNEELDLLSEGVTIARQLLNGEKC